MQLVSTKTDDKIELFGHLSQTEKDNDRIIIHIHGRAGNFFKNCFISPMHEQYVKNGIDFLATQNRGMGSITYFNSDEGSVRIGNTYEKFEDSVLDLDAWVKFAKDLGYKEIWLQGHSLGPTKISYYINQVGDSDISGLILISPSDELGLTRDPIGIKDHERMFPEAQDFENKGKPEAILSTKLWNRYQVSAGHYLNFFSDDSNTAIFNYLLNEIGWDVVNSISIPTLAITGTKDDGILYVMDPKKAMKKLSKELKNAPRSETYAIDGATHDFNDYETDIVERVVRFVSKS